MGVSTSPATGARGAVRIGEEATFGVAVAPTHLLDFTSESITAAETVLESEAIRDDRGRHALIRGNLDINGDINFEQSASGYGMLLRHALGDYIKLDGADGGIHGRSALTAEILIDTDGAGPEGDLGGPTNPDRNIMTFLDDQSTTFAASGKVACVFRDGSNALALVNGPGGVGYDYDTYNGQEATYVESVIGTSSTDYTNPGVVGVTELEMAQVLDEDGNLTAPDFNVNGGVVYLGDDRVEFKYFEYKPGTRRLFLTPTSVSAAAPYVVAANDGAIGKAGLVRTGNSPIGAIAAVEAVNTGSALGAWVYQFDDTNYVGTVYTHHLERGRVLPTGLTVEVDRDAAIFLYTGCKVGTLTLNFETNAIVTGTVTLIGQKEFTMAELVNDAVPGDTSITVDDVTAFTTNAGGGTITIGEETEITFTGITDNMDGTWDLTGIPASGTGEIARFHPAGSNVDPRSSTEAATTYEGDNSPLTSFETTVYMKGSFEEVLSGSITLNNNLNGDKFGLGSRFRLALVEEQAVVEASVTMEFDDGKHYKRFIDGETFALEFRAISEADDAEIGDTGVLASATYFMPKCKFNGTTPVIAGPSFITHDMPLSCIVDDANNNTDLTIILVNGQTNDVEAP